MAPPPYRRTATLSALVSAIFFIALVGLARPASAELEQSAGGPAVLVPRAAKPTVYAVPNTCCKGCSNPAGCCCAPLKAPITKRTTKTTTVKKTKTTSTTLTSTYTATASGVGGGVPRKIRRQEATSPDESAIEDSIDSETHTFEERDESFAEPAIDFETAEPLDEGAAGKSALLVPSSDSHGLFARNLCPVCPAGKPTVPANFGKNNGGSKTVYCCPTRKTVTKTVIKTSTSMATKTSTFTTTTTLVPNKISAIVFVDYAKDGNYTPGDTLKSGVSLDLVVPLARSRVKDKRAVPVCTVVGTNTTNANGLVRFNFGLVPPDTFLCIVPHGACWPCYVHSSANSSGLYDPNAPPLEIPLPPPTTTPTTTTTMTATIPPTAVIYSTPGSFLWYAPASVTEVHVACVGGGAGGGHAAAYPTPIRRLSERSNDDEEQEQDSSADTTEHKHKLHKRYIAGYRGSGGGGGGLGWANNIPVVPGQSYNVVIGAGGVNGSSTNQNGTDGGDSYFISTSTVAGFGGKPAVGGGHFPSGQGGNGGNAAVVPSPPPPPGRRLLEKRAPYVSSSGGGGAGGYLGNGGDGGANGVAAATAGAGGAAGGGFGTGIGCWIFGSGSGGGILLGGYNASDPNSNGVPGNDTLTNGGGGSGGCIGLPDSLTGVKPPMGAGGGVNQPGGDGACRIVWGSGTSWPSNVPSLPVCALA